MTYDSYGYVTKFKLHECISSIRVTDPNSATLGMVIDALKMNEKKGSDRRGVGVGREDLE